MSGGELTSKFNIVQPELPFSDPNEKVLARRDLEAIKQLVEQGMDVNQADSKGNTLLIMAAMQGDVSFAKFLISRGAELERTNVNRNTALQAAIFNRKADMVRLLIDAGARISSRDPARAENIGQTNIAQMLLQAAPDIQRRRAAEESLRNPAVPKHILLRERLGAHKLVIRRSGPNAGP